MTRHYGLSSRMDATGISHPSGPRGADTHANLEFMPLPAALYSRGVPLKASNPLQASLDVIAIGFWASYFLLWFGTIGVLVWFLFS